MTKKRPRKQTWLLLMLMSGLAAIKAGFFLPYEITLGAYANYSPLLAISGASFLCVSLVLCQNLWSLTDKRLLDFFVAFSVMVALAWHIPAERRIDSDESRMIATAQSIRLAGTAYAVDTGVFRQDGTLIATSATLDKRGVFFPAQIAVLDSVFGPSDRHPLWLSWISGLFALFLAARLARRFLPTDLVLFVPLIFGVFPLFANHSRVGTFDVMNLAVMLLLVHVSFSCWYRPDRARFFLLMVVGCVLSQIRYESVALVAVVFVAAMCLTIFVERFAHLRPLAVMAPWMLIPAALRKAVPFDDLLPAPWFSAWSVDNFGTNIEHLLAFVVTGGQHAMGNPWLGAACVLLLLSLPFEWRRLALYTKEQLQRLAVLSISISVPTAIILFYFWGKANLNFTVRYFLPFSLILIFGSLAMVAIVARKRQIRVALAGLLSVVSLVWAFPRTKDAGLLSDLAYAHRVRMVTSVLSKTSFQCEGVLVADRGLVFTIHGFSSISKEELDNPKISALVGTETNRRLDLTDTLFIGDDESFRAILTPLAVGTCSRTLRRIDLSSAKLHGR